MRSMRVLLGNAFGASLRTPPDEPFPHEKRFSMRTKHHGAHLRLSLRPEELREVPSRPWGSGTQPCIAYGHAWLRETCSKGCKGARHKPDGRAAGANAMLARDRICIAQMLLPECCLQTCSTIT